MSMIQSLAKLVVILWCSVGASPPPIDGAWDPCQVLPEWGKGGLYAQLDVGFGHLSGTISHWSLLHFSVLALKLGLKCLSGTIQIELCGLLLNESECAMCTYCQKWAKSDFFKFANFPISLGVTGLARSRQSNIVKLHLWEHHQKNKNLILKSLEKIFVKIQFISLYIFSQA